VFMEGDFVIPPWESIEIVQSGDLVRVVRTAGKNRKDQDKVTNKSNKPDNESNKPENKSKERKPEVNRSKGNKESKVEDVQGVSSSSDSDTNEDITSKVAAAPKDKVSPVKKITTKVKVPMNSNLQRKDDSTTSSDTTSLDEEEINQKNPKTSYSKAKILKARSVTKAVLKKSVKSSRSDSDSSSDDENDENKDKPQHTHIISIADAKSKPNQATRDPEKPKRKRKRKAITRTS
jgi:hypothetical protein